MSISQNFPDEGPTLNLNFAGSKVLDPRITFIRSSVGTYMDANGLVVTASADSPRFDHRYVNGEVESLGLLVEEQRVNLVTNNEDLSLWDTNSNPILNSNDTVSPDGNTTADKLTQTSQVYTGVTTDMSGITTNTVYSCSVFIKPDGDTRTRFGFYDTSNWQGALDTDWSSGEPSTNSSLGGASDIVYEEYPNGWYRASFKASTQSNAFAGRITFHCHPDRTGTGKSAWFWGAQLEAGQFPTSYIPTSGATKTRNHDRAYYENVDQTDWFSKTEGTVVFEHTDVPYNSSTSTGWPAVGFGETAGGGSNPSIQYFITKDYGAAQYLVRRFHPNGDSASISTGGTGSGAPASKVGFVYKEDDYALVRNGSLVGIDTSGAVPNAYMLLFGMNTTGDTSTNWNAHLKNLQYYPTRLSNTVLQNLTK